MNTMLFFCILIFSASSVINAPNLSIWEEPDKSTIIDSIAEEENPSLWTDQENQDIPDPSTASDSTGSQDYTNPGNNVPLPANSNTGSNPNTNIIAGVSSSVGGLTGLALLGGLLGSNKSSSEKVNIITTPPQKTKKLNSSNFFDDDSTDPYFHENRNLFEEDSQSPDDYSNNKFFYEEENIRPQTPTSIKKKPIQKVTKKETQEKPVISTTKPQKASKQVPQKQIIKAKNDSKSDMILRRTLQNVKKTKIAR